MSKNNRRRSKKLGTKEAVLPVHTSYALGLYSYAGKIRLSILHLSADTYWCLTVHEKKAETITALLDVLSESLGVEFLELAFHTALLDVSSESLGLEFLELAFHTDRGKEFEDLSAYAKSHVKTAAYHPEANGKVVRVPSS
jgi:hypothetical protein